MERCGTSKFFSVHSLLYKYFISIKSRPLTISDLYTLADDVRVTKGKYTIQYVPKNSTKRYGREKFPFCIGQDLIRWRIVVSNYAHLKSLGEQVPEIGWLVKYSFLTKEMFDVAASHPGLVLHFGIDFVKYCNVIKENAKIQNIDIHNQPLVFHAMPMDEQRKHEEGINKVIKDKEKNQKSIVDYYDVKQSEEKKYGK